ncbi:hypothetical protein GGX14DRAFT_619843 [Mycena pura]|uniref:Uncharacterized protein n=1 Tax=Mycena pura TaxID=153505 RepID=A0AAD6VIG0_9AGAR|nr:hypothetical protein GGX14DRAFT_619843 [Mycena pura]
MTAIVREELGGGVDRGVGTGIGKGDETGTRTPIGKQHTKDEGCTRRRHVSLPAPTTLPPPTSRIPTPSPSASRGSRVRVSISAGASTATGTDTNTGAPSPATGTGTSLAVGDVVLELEPPAVDAEVGAASPPCRGREWGGAARRVQGITGILGRYRPKQRCAIRQDEGKTRKLKEEGGRGGKGRKGNFERKGSGEGTPLRTHAHTALPRTSPQPAHRRATSDLAAPTEEARKRRFLRRVALAAAPALTALPLAVAGGRRRQLQLGAETVECCRVSEIHERGVAERRRRVAEGDVGKCGGCGRHVGEDGRVARDGAWRRALRGVVEREVLRAHGERAVRAPWGEALEVVVIVVLRRLGTDGEAEREARKLGLRLGLGLGLGRRGLWLPGLGLGRVLLWRVVRPAGGGVGVGVLCEAAKGEEGLGGGVVGRARGRAEEPGVCGFYFPGTGVGEGVGEGLVEDVVLGAEDGVNLHEGGCGRAGQRAERVGQLPWRATYMYYTSRARSHLQIDQFSRPDMAAPIWGPQSWDPSGSPSPGTSTLSSLRRPTSSSPPHPVARDDERHPVAVSHGGGGAPARGGDSQPAIPRRVAARPPRASGRDDGAVPQIVAHAHPKRKNAIHSTHAARPTRAGEPSSAFADGQNGTRRQSMVKSKVFLRQSNQYEHWKAPMGEHLWWWRASDSDHRTVKSLLDKPTVEQSTKHVAQVSLFQARATHAPTRRGAGGDASVTNLKKQRKDADTICSRRRHLLELARFPWCQCCATAGTCTRPREATAHPAILRLATAAATTPPAERRTQTAGATQTGTLLTVPTTGLFILSPGPCLATVTVALTVAPTTPAWVQTLQTPRADGASHTHAYDVFGWGLMSDDVNFQSAPIALRPMANSVRTCRGAHQ